MNLKDMPVLLLDCQTTGMRPPSGRLLEIAWALTTAREPKATIESHLLKLPAGETIPPRVSELTGLNDEDLLLGESLEDARASFWTALARLGQPKLVVIHYAQFEKPFLLDFLDQALPFEVVCTHSLTKRLLPNLPSQNIRGAAGFFGDPVGQLKRAGEHVRATHAIWRGLVEELARRSLISLEDLNGFLAKKEKVAKGRYEYRLPSEKRLKLPDGPGIYRMVAKTGEVLYVGKATSLKSRVNSYFRGKAGRDKRKLELMAQVWDLNVTETKSALEAALLEADEIKKFNPPYNVVMKTGRRHLVFYSRDLASRARVQDSDHPLGPFRNSNWIDSVRAIAEGRLKAAFYEDLPDDQLARALEIFKSQRGLPSDAILPVRGWLALGLNTFRNFEEVESEDEEDPAEQEQEERDYTDEEVAAKYGRLLMRAGAEFWRARRLTKMLNTRVTYVHKGEPRVLDFRNGSPSTTLTPNEAPKPWHVLGIETYDRMSVLLSELDKYEHHIEWSERPG